ncbi:MAG: hypothetical protein IT423_20230 [Pirellulaceae bacterium]|nr:hypothetical protein [Pirellulaceae bacterium]
MRRKRIRQRPIGSVERLESRFAMATFARFDFGTPTSPVDSGYTQVTPQTIYTPASGYGWSSGSVAAIDRATGTPLTRDLNYTTDGTFTVNVPNGTYQVGMLLGDLADVAHDQVGIYLEGALRDTVNTAGRQIVSRSFQTVVTDSQLTLRIRDLGGTDRSGAIQMLDIDLTALQLPTLSINDLSIFEGNSGTRNLVMPITLSFPVSWNVQAQYITRSATAIAGVDYASTSGVLTIPAGSTTTNVAIAINGDTQVEEHEIFWLDMSAPDGATLGRGSAQGFILNDDAGPTLRIDTATTVVSENRTAPLLVTLSRSGSTSLPLSVQLSSNDTSEATVPATFTIPAGVAAVGVEVQVRNDTLADGPKNVTITARAAGYTSGATVLRVEDDDQPPFFRVFDFGTTTSALVGNFARISQQTTYSASVGHGWTGGTILSADRGGPTLLRDFIYTAAGNFAVKLPNGTYIVDLIMGDTGAYGHDQMVVTLEGVQAGNTSTAKNQVVSRSYRTTVSDGQLNVGFQDVGGSDAYVVVQGMRIYDASAGPELNQYWPTQAGVPATLFSARQTDGEGFQSFTTYSAYQRTANTIRVLLPAGYNPALPYRVVYVLPVEAGNGRQFGDGLVTARNHGVQNTHNAIFVAPSFSDIPWYADHATNRSISQETYFRDVVVPFIETQYKTIPGAEGRYLLGFSKSGYGALAMFLRNPDFFARVIAYDSPIAMSDPGSGFGFLGILGSRENFAQNYQITSLLRTHASQLRGQPPRIFLYGYANTFGTFADHLSVHNLMDSLSIPHVYNPGVLRSHVWHSGWMPEVARMLLT